MIGMSRRPFARLRASAGTIALLMLVASLTTTSCITGPNLTTLTDAAEAGGSESGAGADSGSEASAPGDDAAPLDDPAHAACLIACPTGGACEGGTCVLACPGIASCATGVKCPAGIPCRITCTGPRSCGTADCGSATTCRVECTGAQSCGRVRSAASQTEVVCSGKDACADTMCKGDTCTVQCDANACRPMNVQCCATQCTVNGAPGNCG